MIQISVRNSKAPLRVFLAPESVRVVYTARFGFTTEASLKRREKMRRSAGAHRPEQKNEFEFQIAKSAHNLRVVPLRGCEVQNIDDRSAHLVTARQIYLVEAIQPLLSSPSTLSSLPSVEPSTMPKLGFAALVVALLLFPIALYFWNKPQEEVVAVEQEEIKPVILRPQAPTPPPPVEVKPQPTQAAIDPKVKMRKSVTQQLGFLGTLGKKDLNKAVGGLPTEAEKVTAGAGAGGDAGSGGEMLAGMGKGLHQTTVGNTGVSGLGGIGKHGAGGGAGGYGDTQFGGGGGQALSIPMGNSAKVDEGLDRSQIQATILRYLAQVRACYEEGLKRNQALIGQVIMNFEVGGAGQVNFSRVGRSSLNDRPVEDCIGTKMLGWKFPQPRGGKTVKVSYPFMLRPVRS